MIRERSRKQSNGKGVRKERGAASPQTGKQVELVRDLCRYLEANREEQVTLAQLSRQSGLSPAYLQRVFKRITGITPRQYADACRLGLLKSVLKERANVTTAMYEAGFGSSSRLYERSPGQLGMTPAAYRKGGHAAQIRFTITGCPLGRLLLAATDCGICAVRLGDSESSLAEGLLEEYPAAEVRRDDAQLGKWITVLLAHLQGQQPHLDLPLDVQATAFQWRVWQELRSIPYGSTRTYREIAQAIGKPRAVRAVGRACATNPTALVIPCHRAVRADGGMGGYRWGVNRKKNLLVRERRDQQP